jgi:hypothetical protein
MVAGTQQIRQRRISSVSAEFVAAIKRNSETTTELNRKIGRYLADPLRYSCIEIGNKDGETLAAYVVDRDSGTDTVPLFRVAPGKRSETLTRALLSGLVCGAVKAGSKSVLITDEVDPNACIDLGFLKTQSGYLKLVLTGWLRIDDIQLTWNDPAVSALQKMLPLARTNPEVAAEVEHCLWPGKLADADLPCFIVPIYPDFAEHLFDSRLAEGSLFGADVDLALNTESAYYRSAQPGVIVCAPGRVLWYITQSDKYQGTQSIRACSRVVEVVKDTPKVLMSRFRRLGVYEWQNVLDVAGGSLTKEIMAFRFDDSELLRPIHWDVFHSILKSHGVLTQLQSPIKIPSKLFGELYVAAFDSSKVC